LRWLKIKHEQKVKNWCLVLFYFGKKYYDQVCCDVIPMDACHLLFGCPWKVQYDGFENTYSFIKDGMKIILGLSKLELIFKSTKEEENLLVTCSEMEKLINHKDLIYALVVFLEKC